MIDEECFLACSDKEKYDSYRLLDWAKEEAEERCNRSIADMIIARKKASRLKKVFNLMKPMLTSEQLSQLQNFINIANRED